MLASLKKALIGLTFCMAGAAGAETFHFENSFVKGDNLTFEDAQAINDHYSATFFSGYSNNNMNTNMLFNDATGSCIVVCRSHPGYELIGKPLNSQGVTRGRAEIIVSRHEQSNPSHRGNTSIWCSLE
jgi:hypothetical protein